MGTLRFAHPLLPFYLVGLMGTLRFAHPTFLFPYKSAIRRLANADLACGKPRACRFS